MHFVRRSASLLVLLSGEAVAVAAVHRLGSRAPFNLPLDDVDPWLRAAPADALVAALRVVALVLAGWLLLATVAYAFASATSIPAAVRACEWATPRAIRRTIDRALAVSIVAGAVTVPVSAQHAGAVEDRPPPVSVDVRSGKSLGSLPSEWSAPVTVANPPVVPVVDRPPTSTTTTVVVTPGDNLWELSAAALARGTARDRATIADDEIARYWRAVCDANRDTLRSGNVNVIYPGEIVALPPVT
jgi:nucleoid-associated protein YgaU